MKHYYKLTCFFLRYFKCLTLFSIAVAAVVQLGWLWYMLSTAAILPTFQGFVSSPLEGIFLCSFYILVLSFFFFIDTAFKNKQKALYTLYTLPGPRAAIPVSIFTATALCVFLFLFAQCILLFIDFQVFSYQLPNIAERLLQSGAITPDTTLFVNNDLYLAVIRSQVGNLCLPHSLPGVFLVISFVLALATVYTVPITRTDTYAFVIVFIILEGYFFRNFMASTQEKNKIFVGFVFLIFAISMLATTIYWANHCTWFTKAKK